MAASASFPALMPSMIFASIEAHSSDWTCASRESIMSMTITKSVTGNLLEVVQLRLGLLHHAFLIFLLLQDCKRFSEDEKELVYIRIREIPSIALALPLLDERPCKLPLTVNDKLHLALINFI